MVKESGSAGRSAQAEYINLGRYEAIQFKAAYLGSVRAAVRDEGGIKPTKDYEYMPLYSMNKGGLAIDDMAVVLQGRGFNLTPDQLYDSLREKMPKVGAYKPAAQVRRSSSRLDRFLVG